MPREFYLLLHLVGVFLMLGGVFGALIYGKLKPGGQKSAERKILMAAHGIGLLAVFVAGFGLIARLGVGFPTWVLIKILIWLGLGYIISPAVKGKFNHNVIFVITLLLAATAAFFGIYKPF
ncbi:hypothetical protein CHS0354_001992 [Potamilus streckersoni]|uniref:Uncharacterized protein n=1 Tax=Potamilus streckersoni TaxID=2493646 RepID=A0AAE0W7Q4_9BIVA|nr:hypothetical protein CHS0354_001992 [Potamilus streckersoni]